MKDYNNSILALQHGYSSVKEINDSNVKSLKSLWLEIPDYCHLNCGYCYASTDHEPKDISQYLSYNDYERLLKQFAELGGKFLGIPGKGEPFHPKNWELTKKLISLCDILNLDLAIFTTGDAIFFKPGDEIDAVPDKKKIEEIKDKKVILLIKYNSRIPEVQNRLVGDRHNRYAQMREKAIEILISEYKLNEQQRLGIVTSILKDNENEIVDIYKWAKENSIIFDCDTILERGRGKTFTEEKKVPPKVDLEKIFRKLKTAGAFTNCQGGTYVGSTCDRVLHHLYISINGDTFPCIGCLREDIKEKFSIGNIKDSNLSELWNNRLRQRLAKEYKKVFLGTCQKCQNFEDESCYSCLGRCTSKVEEGEDLFIQTTGCINHKPITTTWLASVIDYIRKVVSFNETQNILLNEGLERLWRPNKNIAFTLLQLSNEERGKSIKELIAKTNPQEDDKYKPQDLISDSKIDNFSKKKHYYFSEISFPKNKVWDFIEDPNVIFKELTPLLTAQEKGKVIKEISHSFLSNIFISSFKILFEKYDEDDDNMRYCNFILYDNIKEKYFYRSIFKHEDGNDEYLKITSLIISRWYEDFNSQDNNYWKDYCYDLSNSFSEEIYSDYELKLGGKNHEETEPDFRNRTIDLTNIIESDEIKDRVDAFEQYLKSDDFREKYESVKEFINSKIFVELDKRKIEKLKGLYGIINDKSFYKEEYSDIECILNKLSSKIKELDQNISVSKKLDDEFKIIRKKGEGWKFLNYFVYLGIMKRVFEVDYYYLFHSTNFTSINLDNQELLANSELHGIIKPSGVLICTKKPITHHFRAELKLFISNIFAPFDEFYYNKLYGKNQADKQFQNKIEAHRHTLFNLISAIEPYRSQLPQKQSYLKQGVNYAFIIAEDIYSKKEDRDRIGRKLSDKPDKILIDLCDFFKSNICSNMTFIEKINSSEISLTPIQRIDFFTIIYNIIHNAAKSDTYKYFNGIFEYSLFAFVKNDYYSIIIINPAIMNRRVMHFINSTNINMFTFPFDEEIESNGGLAIIKRIILKNSKYGWSMTVKEGRTKRETQIILKIK